jgi:hypothetical protein
MIKDDGLAPKAYARNLRQWPTPMSFLEVELSLYKVISIATLSRVITRALFVPCVQSAALL